MANNAPMETYGKKAQNDEKPMKKKIIGMTKKKMKGKIVGNDYD